MRQEIFKRNDNTIYNIRFANLTDLHDYLQSNPKVNRDVFMKQASLNDDYDFYGEPLEKAIAYCSDGYNEGFENFLEANNELQQASREISDNRKLVRSLYGGIPLAPLVAMGVPDCMLKYDRGNKSTVRNIYFNLGYPAYTSTSEIVNRGLATLYIVQAFEAKGDLVNFRAFELSSCDDEIVNIELNLKKPGDLFLDVQKCYFPIKGKEFLRRNFFRVLESAPVTNSYWMSGYGRAANVKQIRKFFNVSSQDLVISFPSEMGIKGDNIYDDTISLIESLDLQQEFDIQKIKKIKSRH